MATPQGQRLIESHRRAQLVLGARTVRAARSVWPLLDPADIDRTIERWLTSISLIINGQRTVSARLAANFVQAFRTIELGTTAPAPPMMLAETVPAAAVATSMIVTGPASVKSAIRRGVAQDVAMDTAAARSSAATSWSPRPSARSARTPTTWKSVSSAARWPTGS